MNMLEMILKLLRINLEGINSCQCFIQYTFIYLKTISDYTQLGLAYKLENSNINFNIALTYYYCGRPEDGQNQLQLARDGASNEQNSVIDDCIRDEAKVSIY